MNCEVKCQDQLVRSAIKITEESVEETVTVLVVENSVGRKLLCEQTVSFRSPAPISPIQVI